MSSSSTFGRKDGGTVATCRAPATRRWRAALFRSARRLHLWLSLLTAIPLLILSISGALLVFGHELEELVSPRPVVAAGAPQLQPQALLSRIHEQKPDLRVWAVVPSRADTDPWTIWLADGGGVLDVDPGDGTVLRHYSPDETPYGIVRALHRRWLVDGAPAARWARHSVSAVALLVMLQVVLGLWLWLLPGKRLARLKPVLSRSRHLAIQRLHLLSGVTTGTIMLLVAFTGIAMFWQETARNIVEAVAGEEIEPPGSPDLPPLAPLTDLDAAVALARSMRPDAHLVSWRPPERAGAPLHAALAETERAIPTRIWVGGDPLRILHVSDGQGANLATRIWHLRYWLHVGDFAGPTVRALWVIVALMPAAFTLSGLWLWRSRTRRRTSVRST